MCSRKRPPLLWEDAAPDLAPGTGAFRPTLTTCLRPTLAHFAECPGSEHRWQPQSQAALGPRWLSAQCVRPPCPAHWRAQDVQLPVDILKQQPLVRGYQLVGSAQQVGRRAACLGELVEFVTSFCPQRWCLCLECFCCSRTLCSCLWWAEHLNSKELSADKKDNARFRTKLVLSWTVFIELLKKDNSLNLPS